MAKILVGTLAGVEMYAATEEEAGRLRIVVAQLCPPLDLEDGKDGGDLVGQLRALKLVLSRESLER